MGGVVGRQGCQGPTSPCKTGQLACAFTAATFHPVMDDPATHGRRSTSTLEVLRASAAGAAAGGRLTRDARTIRGLWQTSYVIRLAPGSSTLHLSYVVVQ